MDARFWILAASSLVIVAGTAWLAWECRRARKSAGHYRALYLACHEQMAARMVEDRRKAQAAATERRARLIAFPEQPAPFKQPPWGSTFPINDERRS